MTSTIILTIASASLALVAIACVILWHRSANTMMDRLMKTNERFVKELLTCRNPDVELARIRLKEEQFALEHARLEWEKDQSRPQRENPRKTLTHDQVLSVEEADMLNSSV